MVDLLEEHKRLAHEFKHYFEKLDIFDGFFESLKELGGRDKLIKGLENTIDTFKNTWLLLGVVIDSVFGGTAGSGLANFIDGFYVLSEIFQISDDNFEDLANSIDEFFHGGLQTKVKEFLYG